MAVAKDPNDPGFVEQYALADGADDDIDAPAAWNDLTSCAKVAVLDTGIQLDHPDLKSEPVDELQGEGQRPRRRRQRLHR